MNTRTPGAFLAALNVEKANMDTYKSELGFGGAEITENEQDQANLEVALDNVEVTNENKKSVTQVKDAIFDGDVNESVNPYPTFVLTALPFPDVKAGALSRYNNRKGRAKLAAGYTEQIGIAMGYQDEPGAAIPPGSVKPVIESAHPAASGYAFALLISNRADADSADLFIRRAGSETWTKVETFTGKSCDVTVTPTTPGVPEKVQVMVQLKRKNENYGQQSDVVSVTLNP